MEARLFDAVPEYTTSEWYAERESAPHLEQDGHRQRLELSAEMVRSVVPAFASVLDLGCGDGGLLSLLPEYRAYGYDLQQSNVEAAKARHVDVRYGDVLQLELPTVDCVVLTEMLEHLEDPHALVQRVYDSGARWLVASSPYTETAASHYEFHTWAWDRVGYEAMLVAAGFRIIRSATVWICQCVLAERVQA